MDNIVRFFEEGGFWMAPTALISLMALAVSIDRVVFVMFKYNCDAAAFFSQIQKLVAADQIDRAMRVCSAAGQAAVARVVKAGLKYANRGEAEIQSAIAEETLAVMPLITKRTNLLGSLASLATLNGLLGTVFGLIGAFRAVANAPADQKSAILTGAISEAMNCTAFGLLVGIPALFMHLIVTGMAKKVIDDVDHYGLKLENLLVARGRGTIEGAEG